MVTLGLNNALMNYEYIILDSGWANATGLAKTTNLLQVRAGFFSGSTTLTMPSLVSSLHS
jgi:hypothetical protein